MEEKEEIDETLGVLIQKVGLPGEVFGGLNLNDTFRLEQKIGLGLFLDATDQTHA